MLRSVKDLLNYSLRATEGKIGAVDDFLFDDREWTVRYLVANTGGWLHGRMVLVAPASLGQPEWQSRVFPVSLSRSEIEEGPDILTDAPLERQKEWELARHYNWPVYWATDGFGGFGAAPILPPEDATAGGGQLDDDDRPHLRSVREVRGYRLHADDGDIGHIDDFIVDDERWVIRYLVVDTRNWLPGRKVLLACDWVEEVSWTDAKVLVCLSKEKVRGSPAYDASAPVNREYEGALHDYYGRPRYWESPRKRTRAGIAPEAQPRTAAGSLNVARRAPRRRRRREEQKMTQTRLEGMRVAILATDDFERVELTEPQQELESEGATTLIVSPKSGHLQSMNHDVKADVFEVDMTLDEAHPDDFDALLLPGGVINADALRMDARAQEFVRKFDAAGKPIAVICHGPWLLVSAGLAKGRTLTSWPTLQDDIRNAGGHWVDKEVVRDHNWVSSRGPRDLPAFNREMVRLFAEAAGIRRAA